MAIRKLSIGLLALLMLTTYVQACWFGECGQGSSDSFSESSSGSNNGNTYTQTFTRTTGNGQAHARASATGSNCPFCGRAGYRKFAERGGYRLNNGYYYGGNHGNQVGTLKGLRPNAHTRIHSYGRVHGQ